MAGTTGLEPATSAVTGQRSNQLSYVPMLIAGDYTARFVNTINTSYPYHPKPPGGTGLLVTLQVYQTFGTSADSPSNLKPRTLLED